MLFFYIASYRLRFGNREGDQQISFVAGFQIKFFHLKETLAKSRSHSFDGSSRYNERLGITLHTSRHNDRQAHKRR